jgi:hypothetical protein
VWHWTPRWRTVIRPRIGTLGMLPIVVSGVALGAGRVVLGLLALLVLVMVWELRVLSRRVQGAVSASVAQAQEEGG